VPTRFLGLGSGMDGTDIDNFFTAGVGDALIDKRHYPKNDESVPTRVIELMRIQASFFNDGSSFPFPFAPSLRHSLAAFSPADSECREP
jgi:hypothetical protein